MNKSIVIPDCPSCIYFHNCADKSIPICCDAYPSGIPNDYLYGPVQVKSLKECNNGLKYTESEK